MSEKCEFVHCNYCQSCQGPEFEDDDRPFECWSCDKEIDEELEAEIKEEIIEDPDPEELHPMHYYWVKLDESVIIMYYDQYESWGGKLKHMFSPLEGPGVSVEEVEFCKPIPKPDFPKLS